VFQQLLEALERTVKQPDHENRVLQAAVTRIVVEDERVEIHVSKDSLRGALLGPEIDPHGPRPEGDSTEVLILQAPARLKRCGGEIRFVLPPDSGHDKSHPVPSLIRAVARAHHWVDRIGRGDATTQRSIAAETGLDARYVSRILPLAFLAPDLTEAILDGTHSPDLALGSCLENLSANWVEQRSSFDGHCRRL
jgi:site-specific DNA recombinase